jgi:hypothetical protein
MTTRTDPYKIFYASGDRFRDPNTDQDTFTAAEAAKWVEIQPWAWIDSDGDLIVNTYRDRCGADQYKPITGRQMAARLRKQA